MKIWNVLSRMLILVAMVMVAGCSGSGGGGGVGNSTPVSSLALLAGNMGGSGNADGTGAVARFNAPTGVAADSAGNVYVADLYNHTIRKITPAGVVTTFAGTAGIDGSVDGTGAAARFNNPRGVATDSAGNVYVADWGNSTIRKITPAGVVTTLAGMAETSGNADGTGAAASFHHPSGVATDSAGNVYVADESNSTIRKITPAGVVTTLAGTAGITGSADGTGAAARFTHTNGVATDSAGNVYVADVGNHTIRKITSAGAVTTFAGTAGTSGSTDGIGATARFEFPMGVATDSAGNVYVADVYNNTIGKITSAGVVTTLAGAAVTRGSTDGAGVAASFNNPSGVATDSAGNTYVADIDNHTIRKITPAGVVTTLAGAAGISGSTDGTGAAARFYYPKAVVVDSSGNVYVADWGNHTIRKITPAGVVTTLAGTAGTSGSTDGTGGSASFYSPSSVATDSAGNVYVADTNNYTIRKITPVGVVTTLAGTAGISGSADGAGAAASFSDPESVATDSAGNVYVSEFNTCTIRKITSTGLVTTLAGMAGEWGSTDGTGAAARFGNLLGVATDSAGNVYVADWGNSTIRRITPAGAVTTVVGGAGQAGFGPGSLPGLLSGPTGVAVSGNSLYITMANGVAVVRNLP